MASKVSSRPGNSCQLTAMGSSSWANNAASGPSLVPKAMKLQYLPPSDSAGRLRIVASAAVSSEGAKEWSFTLVGQFVGTNLSFSAVRSIARSIWLKEGSWMFFLMRRDLFSFGLHLN